MNENTLEHIASSLQEIELCLDQIMWDTPSLRDRIAMAAITGILAGKWGQMPQYRPEEAFADFAYRVADAMIERMEKQ